MRISEVRLCVNWCMLVSALSGVVHAGSSPLGPDGVTRIIVEAEDMQGVDWQSFGAGSPDWQVGRHG